MLRVLHIVSVLHRGGVETMLMNFYRNIDRSLVQFDFIVHGDRVGEYEPIVKEMGSRVYHVRTKGESFLGNLRDIEKVVRENQYDVVEVHQDAMSMFALRAAKKGGAKIRIAHAHSTAMPPSRLGKIIYPYAIARTTKYANVKFSCSEKSSAYLFDGDTDGVTYIYNGIDTDRFRFSEENREKIRQQYGLSGFVLAQVGNFMHPKNQHFTLLVFEELKKLCPDATLLFCGGGQDLETIRQEAAQMGLSDSVIFAGSVENVHEMLSAFDALIMPSFYEGFPVSLIEAQCAGLSCLASDTITRETAITDLMCFLPLSAEPKQWAKALLEEKDPDRASFAEKVKEAGFDVLDVAEKLQNIYLGFLGDKKSFR